MSKRLDQTTCNARAEALEECADHMDQPWTADEPTRSRPAGPEWQAGQWLQKQLRVEAQKYRDRAHRLTQHQSSKFL